MTLSLRLSLLSIALLVMATSAASGASITIDGRTASIGNGFTAESHFDGSHFHSSNLVGSELPPGNPGLINFIPGAAEVGGFFGDEDIRGTSEFDVRGLGPGTSATVVFDVVDVDAAEGGSGVFQPIDGLFGQGTFEGTVDVFAYSGNNVEEVADYSGNQIGADALLSLDATVLTPGETISIPVTGLYNDLISGLAANPDTAASAMGIRLQSQSADPNDGGIVFNNFRLFVETEEIPEPTSLALLLFGLIPFVSRRRA